RPPGALSAGGLGKSEDPKACASSPARARAAARKRRSDGDAQLRKSLRRMRGKNGLLGGRQGHTPAGGSVTRKERCGFPAISSYRGGQTGSDRLGQAVVRLAAR